jgi:hypothetical protein
MPCLTVEGLGQWASGGLAPDMGQQVQHTVSLVRTGVVGNHTGSKLLGFIQLRVPEIGRTPRFRNKHAPLSDTFMVNGFPRNERVSAQVMPIVAWSGNSRSGRIRDRLADVRQGVGSVKDRVIDDHEHVIAGSTPLLRSFVQLLAAIDADWVPKVG